MEEYDLIECIDRGLDRFGSSVKNSIFLKLSFIHNSDSSEIIQDPFVFKSVIEEIFGQGAGEIETSIICEIKKAFQLAADETKNMVSAIIAAKKHVICTFSSIASLNRPRRAQAEPES